MKRGTPHLSEAGEALALADETGQTACFDVLIVGSGYGGAVAAARLAGLQADGQALRVAVLERGREYLPGDFPRDFTELAGHARTGGAAMPGQPEGLFDLCGGEDVMALVANGLGGGSLINAGVCEPASPGVLARKAWPAPWRANTALWTRLYAQARQLLGAQPWPDAPPGREPKQTAMAGLAGLNGGSVRRVQLSIVPPEAPAGSHPEGTYPCARCGDCFSGCNVGAKLTLGHTCLRQAHAQGAQLYTGITVNAVSLLDAASAEASGALLTDRARWRVACTLTDASKTPGATREFAVLARHVVLAAGTFGSTDILMRSRGRGLSVSGRLGQGFSANGDVVGTFYRLPWAAGSMPRPETPLDERQCGPTITSQWQWPPLPRGDGGGEGEGALEDNPMVTQELTVPAALYWLFSEWVCTQNVPERWTHWDLSCHHPEQADPFAVDHAAMQRTLLTVSYVDDGAQGVLTPDTAHDAFSSRGRLNVRWPALSHHAVLDAATARLASATPEGSSHLRNPLWQFMPQASFLGWSQTTRRLLTVHPLGGCRMADTADDGVVDPFGRVFHTGLNLGDGGDGRGEQRRRLHEGNAQRAVHAGLCVLDGAIVPTSLGINPLLTITALAAGIVEQWVADEGWQTAAPQARTPPAPRPRPELRTLHAPARKPTRVRYDERMVGPLQLPDSWPNPRPEGDLPGQPMLLARFRFDTVPDLQAFLQQRQRRSRFKARLHLALGQRQGADQVYQDDRHLPGSQPLLLRGTVFWMRPQGSGPLRRLVRSAWTVWMTRYDADNVEARHRGRSPWESLWQRARAASHYGAIRELAYTFDPLPRDWCLVPERPHPLDPRQRLPGFTLPAGTRLSAVKEVGYRLSPCLDKDSANPVRQLTEVKLCATLPNGQVVTVAQLEFDVLAMLDRDRAPLQIVGQDTALDALRDTISLMAYFGRTLFGLHMLSLRRPEYPVEVHGPRGLQRLPDLQPDAQDLRFAGLCITRHHWAQDLPADLALHGDTEAMPLVLTRYRRAGDVLAGPPPVVLLHGFGSGGIQYTHDAIDQPLAPWLARQGHDVWVAELRTSIGQASAHAQSTLDDVALEDVPALLRQVCALSGQPQVQVVAHCIGAAMFCIAALNGRLQGLVQRAVLLQVAPYAEVPRLSRARAYLGVRMQQLLGLGEVHSVASQDISDAESILDRLLSAYLFPKDQRAAYHLTGDLAANTRRVNALRSAGIFGQLFQHENMTPAVLDHLDDLLGLCNLTTYIQTAQFATHRRLTDLAGQDHCVQTQRLRDGLNFPLLLLHGQFNRTFAVDGHRRSLQALCDLGLPCEGVIVPGHGHLDMVVGRHTAQAVFPALRAHLLGQPLKDVVDPAWLTPLPAPQPLPPRPPLRGLDAGPWLGHVWQEDADFHLRFGVRVDSLGKGLNGIVVLPLLDGQAPVDWPAPRWHAWPEQAVQEGTFDIALPGAWLQGRARALKLVVMAWLGPPPSPRPGPGWHPLPLSPAGLLGGLAAWRRRRRQALCRRGAAGPSAESLLLDTAWLARQLSAEPQPFTLALGACRQRPFMLDRSQADRSMGALLHDVKAGRIDAVLLCGDQVYADSRADAQQPRASTAAFQDAHEEAWRAPAQAEVLRRVGAWMLVDDHEFRDNHNQRIARQRPLEWARAHRVWWRFQLAAGPLGLQAERARGGAANGAAANPAGLVPNAPLPTWVRTQRAGHAFFLSDTRTEREEGPGVSRTGARIWSEAQWQDLAAWLTQQAQQAPNRPAFIGMATPPAPCFAEALGHPAHAVRTDAWSRFPDDHARLWQLIANSGHLRVVILCGDFHRFAHVVVRLAPDPARRIDVHCVVTGGLYAPYPFANTDASEWWRPGPEEWLTDGRQVRVDAGEAAQGGLHWRYDVVAEAAGSGHAQVQVDAQGQLQVRWHPTDLS